MRRITFRLKCALFGVIFAACLFTAMRAPAQQFQDQTLLRFPTDRLEYTNQCSVADVDGDGDLDIAWANGGGFPAAGPDQQVRLFINDGLGFFTDETNSRIGFLIGDWRGVEFGDVDGDGDPDMALANDNNQLPALLINNGAGFFANETGSRLPPITLGSSRVQFADVENDGDLDLYFTNGGVNRFGSGQGKLYINNGAGFFADETASRMPAGSISEPQDAIFGDIDLDFDLDLRVGSTGNNQSRLYVNDGSGVFSAASTPADQNCYSYDFGDMDGDGDLDLLGANGSSSGNNAEILLRNNGPLTPGGFTNVSGQISPNPSVDDNDTKFFDHDNDGDLDYLIARISGPERVYTNNGAGFFTEAALMITPIADSSLDVKVADLTGDGRLDVITAQGESGNFTNRIYVNATGPIDTRPPTVVKTEQAPDTPDTVGPYVIRTIIYDSHTSDRGFHDKGVFLDYTVSAGPTETAEMRWVGNSMWRGEIPGQQVDSEVEYFVRANDFVGNTGFGETLSFRILRPPCPADIAPEKTGGDSEVNVSDLLLVIAEWGNAGGPADITGDGVVNVSDLLEVIAAWGPCM